MSEYMENSVLPKMPKAGLSKNTKIVIGVIATFVATMVGVFYLVFALTGALTKVVDSFFTQIAQGNMSAAYNGSSENFKKLGTLEEFGNYAQEMGFDDYEKSSWTNRSIENNRGSLSGSIILKTGEVVPLSISLVKENGAWRVYSIDPDEESSVYVKQKVEMEHPTLSEAEELVENTMRSFAQAYEKKDYTEFNKEISEALQEKVAPMGFDEVFKNIKLDSDAIQYLKTGSPAIASDTPFVDENGTLIIDGSYPNTVDFTFKYIPENSQWKLVAIYLD